MLTVLTVIGTRPETIKLAPVIRELDKYPQDFRSVVCATAQHRQMLDRVLELFAIETDHDLNIMEPAQELSRLTARLLDGLSAVVTDEKPNWILAQGDTTTVLASALTAFYHKIPFGHVEAGLRTGDIYHPYPEELNRRIADRIATLLFAPTEHSRQVLVREGIPEESVRVTGNTIVDALMEVAARPYDWAAGPLAGLPGDHKLVLITAHRRESFGEPLREICFALRELALRFSGDGVHFVYPVHPNPNVRQPVAEILSGIANLSLLEPLDYKAMVHLIKRSILILTDSGGIQEEAPSLRVPVLVMRRVTERPEGVEAGVVRVVGTDRASIVAETSWLIENPHARAEMATGVNPFGDGHAAKRIVSALQEHANLR